MTLTLHAGRYCLSLFKGGPVPLGRIRFLRKMCFGTNPLLPAYTSLRHTGLMLNNQVLRHALAEEEMGTWSMCPATFNLLESEIGRRKPGTILVFGSGLSTVCLAQYMLEQYGESERIYVCSIEQDAGFIGGTVSRLKDLGLDRYVKIYHAPLSERVVETYRHSCYSLPADCMAALATLRPDFIVIDGPSAEDAARFSTLPVVRQFLSRHARFYLDDALRDGEIEAARRWSRLSYVSVGGMYLTQKGLLTGEVNPEAAS
jgi:predicted O-methyltransferase YrrM